ncbi:MAG TPA: phosphatase PAP2 family protein [Pseudolabrys sp.]|nr:phosphatase PAP2 family protein [Pseudolabrys sp.]
MNFGLLARKIGGRLIQSRVSPVSRAATILTVALAIAGVLASLDTRFTLASLPNVMPLLVGVMALDGLSQLVPQPRIAHALQTVLYGVLYIAVTVLCAILAAYAMQRFAFPMRDGLFARMDTMLGFDWLSYAHWVDGHLSVQRLFHFAYNTIQIQIVLPLVVLALFNRPGEARTYLLAFAIALSTTIVISALLPAAGPVVFVDRASFHNLKFTGATPLDHLMMLREAGPLVLREMPGGIATFPSFHSTIAVLTPLVLRRHRRIFIVLLVLDAFMLGGTITEGAHYLTDVMAGSAMAFFAYFLARYILSKEDARRCPAPSAAHAIDRKISALHRDSFQEARDVASV